MLIYILYQIILILGEYFVLGGFKLGYEVFDVYGLDFKYLECRYNRGFILYARHKFLVKLVTRNV